MQLENEVYEYIRQMIDEEASRLEIVESCISEFGDDYPDLEYDDWSKLVKSLIPKDEDEEEVSDIYLPPMPSQVSSVKDTYEKALSKLLRMVEWADTSSVPLEKWTVNGVSKWAKQYKECLELCKCLELDYFENSIDDALYNDISSAISKVEEYTSLLPKIKALDERYLDDSKSLNYSRRRKVEIPDYYSRKDKYLSLVSSIPPTTSSERKKLSKRYHDGDKSALDAIIESYLPLIYNMAVQFHSLYPPIDIQDFFGEGVEVFVYNYVQYESRYRNIIGYIMAAVKSRMAKYASNYAYLLPIPRKILPTITDINRFCEKSEMYNGRRPYIDEIIDHFHVPDNKAEEFIKVWQVVEYNNSLEELPSDYNFDALYSEKSPPDAGLLYESLKTEADHALTLLVPRETEILQKFFGLNGPEKSLDEIGEEIGLTKERVRQIKEKAIKKLSESKRSKVLKSYLGDEIYNYSPYELTEYNKYRSEAQTIINKESEGAMLVARKHKEEEENENKKKMLEFIEKLKNQRAKEQVREAESPTADGEVLLQFQKQDKTKEEINIKAEPKNKQRQTKLDIKRAKKVKERKTYKKDENAIRKSISVSQLKYEILKYLYCHPNSKASELALHIFGNSDIKRPINQCIYRELNWKVLKNDKLKCYYLSKEGCRLVEDMHLLDLHTN